VHKETASSLGRESSWHSYSILTGRYCVNQAKQLFNCLPLVEVWEDLQPEVERLTGLAGLKIIPTLIINEPLR